MTTRTRRPKIKQSKHLTLRDRLSRLTYVRACQLLGPSGAELIREGSNYEIDIERDVYLRGDLFRVKFPNGAGGKDAVATITTMAAARNRLKFNCTACETICQHVGAAVSLVLEEKTALGLAAPPDENRPLELLSESELVERALARATGAGQEREVPHLVVRRRQTLDRLHGGQRPVGQDLSRGPAGRRAGAIVLLVPRLPHQHARHLQAYLALAGPRAAALSGGRAAEALSQSRGVRPRALRRRDDPAPATARQGRSRTASAWPARWSIGRSTTCGSWSSSSARWSGWATT